MAETISASVGIRARNLPPDVEKIQRLLNRVPTNEGGPVVKLKEDGLCGPKTTKAIQQFQLHHFGWNGADGRILPEGETLRKLNEYSPKRPGIPPKPPKPEIPPPPPQPRGLKFGIIQPGDADNIMDEEHEYFFRLVMRENFFRPRIYWLGPKGGYKHVSKKAKFTRKNWEQKVNFNIYEPRTLDELECEAMLLMDRPRRRANGMWMFSRLLLRLGPNQRVVSIPILRPLDPRNPAGKTDRGRPVFARRGLFQLVRNPRRYVDDEIWTDLPEIKW